MFQFGVIGFCFVQNRTGGGPFKVLFCLIDSIWTQFGPLRLYFGSIKKLLVSIRYFFGPYPGGLLLAEFDMARYTLSLIQYGFSSKTHPVPDSIAFVRDLQLTLLEDFDSHKVAADPVS